MREGLELARKEAEKAERDYDLERVAKLRHGTIPDIEKHLAEAEKADGRARGRFAASAKR